MSQRARHYTRDGSETGIQVCSVEIWAFADEARARLAEANFHSPGWRIQREGHLLIMLRALSMRRGEGPRRGVFADCQRLGDRTVARAAAALGRETSATPRSRAPAAAP